jgi:signal transduction histidine kinase
MTSARDRRAREAIDRPLGWLVGIGGCILILDQTLAQGSVVPDFALWWTAGAALVGVALVLLGAFGLYLPMRVLEVAWRGIPLLYVVLQATWSIALIGPDPESVVPWLWTLEPAVITLMMLVAPPAVAVAVGFSFSLVPALSGLVVFGHVPHAVLITTPSQLSNVLYLVIFVALHHRLRRLHAREQRARYQRARQVRTSAQLDQQVALQRIVHDEVLSVLTSAMLVSGAPSDDLRRDARRAINALNASTGGAEGRAPIEGRAAADLITAELRRIDPAAEVSVSAVDALVPRPVIDGVGQAAAEALRNSVRHAGDGASRSVSVQVEGRSVRVRVRDDGVGFQPLAVGGRLGIAESIVGRMADLGGTARIDSAPGLGTEVTLSWSD